MGTVFYRVIMLANNEMAILMKCSCYVVKVSSTAVYEPSQCDQKMYLMLILEDVFHRGQCGKNRNLQL